MKATKLLALCTIAIMFGFILGGSGGSGRGAQFSLVSSNKIFAPPVQFGVSSFAFQFPRLQHTGLRLGGNFNFRLGFLDP